jgi:hypothetical protein
VTRATTHAAGGEGARAAAGSSQSTIEGPLVGLGVRGRGDRELRVRRARLRALEALAAAHPEEFEHLLSTERAAENL